MSGQIFISYRGDDSAAWATLLYRRLFARFPRSQIFIDVNNIEAIEESVGVCVVLIALVGKRWLLSSGEEEKRRLEDPEDFVHRQIANALKNNIRVIPVLVGGASMPHSSELPDDLKGLFSRETLTFSHANTDDGFQRLVDSIDKVLKKDAAEHREGADGKARDQGLVRQGGGRDGGHTIVGTQIVGTQFGYAWPCMPRDPDACTLLAMIASGEFPKNAEHRTTKAQAKSERNPVDCTVFAPDRVEREQSALLQVFLHTPDERQQAEADAVKFDPETKERGHKSLVLDAPEGTIFAFVVEIEGFVFREREDTLLWTGKAQAATFRFDVPKDCRWGQHTGTVRILKDGLPVGRISFQIELVRDASTARGLPVLPVGKEARHYNACFCSYSSLDRAEMLKRAQGLRATGLETFIDVMTLRPGDVWNPKIFAAIDESDLFVVIWSKNARDSKWVKKESRYALKLCEERGRPDFVPIPVEGPPIPCVPRGLNARHFNDELLGLIRAAEVEAEERDRKKAEQAKPEA